MGGSATGSGKWIGKGEGLGLSGSAGRGSSFVLRSVVSPILPVIDSHYVASVWFLFHAGSGAPCLLPRESHTIFFVVVAVVVVLFLPTKALASQSVL